VADELPVAFGQLLRRLRKEAGLTLEELAERAGVSVGAISSLERGKASSPHESTVARLAWGLRLQDPVKKALIAAARGQSAWNGFPFNSAAAPPQMLPRDIASFTGRAAELSQLLEHAAGSGGVVSIHAIRGMAGIGKTALAVHAAHQLAAQFPGGQIFLELNAHIPGQHPADPSDALASLLEIAGADARQIPRGLNARARLWRHWLGDKRMLLLLDDAASSEQVRPLLPGTAGSLVLITSRQNLAALEDVHAVSLDVLTEDEAAELLVRLADRPGLDRGDPAVQQLSRLCGNLPLALGILGRRLQYSPTWTPADLAADLAGTREKLQQMKSEAVSVAAAFDLSYQELTEDQQRMFRRLGLHPGADTDAWAAAALDEVSLAASRRHLQALYDRNMIAEPSRGRYRFHELIREHARALAEAGDLPADRDAALGRLLDFYRHTAAAASRHLAWHTPARPAGTYSRWPAHSPDVSTRQRAATWMAAERLNLEAAAGYAAAQGYPAHAIAIAAAMHGFLRSNGHWDQSLALHQAALEAAEREGDRLAEAAALTDLADVQYLTGDYAAADASLTRALELSRVTGNPLAEANALAQAGVLRQATGDYPAATASLGRALDLSRSRGDRLGEARALNSLGIIHFLTGNLAAAAASQQQALDIYLALGDELGEASALNSLGGVQQATGDYLAAVGSITRAQKLYQSLGDRIGEAYATGNLGAVQFITGDQPGAAANLSKALEIYRGLGSRNGEADTLNNLGALNRAAGNYQAAADSLTQALRIYQDLGDKLGEAGALSELGVLQHATRDYPSAAASLTRAVELAHEIGEPGDEAEALNNLGDLHLDTAAVADAQDKYAQAFTIATRINSPLEQARALEGTGRCLLETGEQAAGKKKLQRSLTIYEQIGSPNSRRVENTLADLDS
jgi:tetratricopeptide (TPR) repeat protein